MVAGGLDLLPKAVLPVPNINNFAGKLYTARTGYFFPPLAFAQNELTLSYRPMGLRRKREKGADCED